MGLLTLGHPLSWEETKKYAQFIREHGIEQFINLYKRLKDRRNDCLKWGDEVRKNKSFSCYIFSIRLNLLWFVLIMKIKKFSLFLKLMKYYLFLKNQNIKILSNNHN